MNITGNKGEWSEIYAFFKLLGDGVVYAGDEDLNKIEEIFYPIIKILRSEKDGEYEYHVNGDFILVTEQDEELMRLPIQSFIEKSQQLLEAIRGNNGSFAVPEIQQFMEEIHCQSLKADSATKADIRIVVHDLVTGMRPQLAFSIKSYAGGNSTLLNASGATNFVYRITDCSLSDQEIASINAISTRTKIRDRINRVEEKGGHFEFLGMDNSVFMDNLIMVDSLLPVIMSRILYLYFSSDTRTIKGLTEKVAEENIISYDTSHNHRYYEHKMKNFLSAVALGMMPATTWNGLYEANGGYLIVKEDGDVLCYHFYNRNLFESYLYNNTKLEAASSTRHAYATVEKDKTGQLYFKLNLQIRFK